MGNACECGASYVSCASRQDKFARRAFHAYDYRVKKRKNSAAKRRTVQWGEDVDALAVTLAAARGYYPEKSKGGVSKFLSDLVMRATKDTKAK